MTFPGILFQSDFAILHLRPGSLGYAVHLFWRGTKSITLEVFRLCLILHEEDYTASRDLLSRIVAAAQL
jgi:hypothetical protein